MAAGRHDIVIEKGATYSLACTWTDDNGSATNLAGYTIRGKIKKSQGDIKELVSFTCTITNAANGQFTISLNATQTATLPFIKSPYGGLDGLKCWYDIEAVTGSTVYRLFEGIAQINAEVTT